MLRRLFAAAFVALVPVSFALAQNPPAADAKKDVRPAGVWYGVEKARPKAKGALRLSCYNLENLFDQTDDPANPYDQDEMTKPERLEALAKAIRELDADVLCLEEIESKECLLWFRDTYLKGMGYDHAASEDNGYNRGIEQSVLSRVPIVSARIYSGDDLVISDMEPRRSAEAAARLGGAWAPPATGAMPERFQRSPLRVELKTKDGYPLTVYVVHFKAGRDFDHQRELEALQVEAWVEEELKANPNANIAVVGDYNGIPSDMNVKALRMSDDGLVSAFDWRFDKKAPKDTFVTHASGRSIDFIVMSPGLAADCVDGSYFVFGTLHAASDWDYRKADEIPPPKGYASDHYPVSIDLMTKSDRPASAFKRAAPSADDADDAPRAAGAPRSGLRSDAREPTADEIARHAKPEGAPSKADEALAKALRAAGWRYELPYPKSKTAEWAKRGGNSTWWPGYWTNAKTGATSRATPSEANGMKGDGKGAPAKDEFTKSGAPARLGWVEWLCSEAGAAK